MRHLRDSLDLSQQILALRRIFFAISSNGLGGQPISSIRSGRMLGTPPRPQIVVVGMLRSIIASSLPPLAEAALPDLDGLSVSPCAHHGARGAGASHEAGRSWIMWVVTVIKHVYHAHVARFTGR